MKRRTNERIALDIFLTQYQPASADDREWTWDDETSDILHRECLCCGVVGHYQQQLETHLAGSEVIVGICVGPDGRVRDGHHRIVAARRLGIPWVELESPEENAQRWVRDHGHVGWKDRKFGDRSNV